MPFIPTLCCWSRPRYSVVDVMRIALPDLLTNRTLSPLLIDTACGAKPLFVRFTIVMYCPFSSTRTGVTEAGAVAVGDFGAEETGLTVLDAVSGAGAVSV